MAPRRIPFAIAVLLAISAGGTSCHKKGEDTRGVPGERDQSRATLAQLAHETGLRFPPSARLVGSAREDGIDDLLRFKVQISPAELAAFLAASPVPAAAFESGEGGLLGPDQGFWDPSRAKHLRTGQKILPGQRALNIGIDDGRADVVALYIVNHGT